NASDAELLAQAEIRLDENAHRGAAGRAGQFARGRADAALELKTGHARAAADVALRDRPRLGTVEGCKDVFLLDVEAVGVIEIAIVRFRDDRQHPGLMLKTFLRPPLADRVAHGAHTGGAGQ